MTDFLLMKKWKHRKIVASGHLYLPGFWLGEEDPQSQSWEEPGACSPSLLGGLDGPG